MNLRQQVPITPCKSRSGTNVRSHVLVRHGNGFRYRISLLWFLLMLVTIACGGVMLARVWVLEIEWLGRLLLSAFGGLMIGVGVWNLFRSFCRYPCFDGDALLFCRGKYNPGRGRECVSFGDIHALQLVSDRWRSGRDTIVCYELNLVLRDGSRVSVIAMGEHEKIREDAKLLADFLQVPVWDETFF